VDLAIASARPPGGVELEAGVSDTGDLSYLVPLDHDVDRSARRGAGAVDERDAADDEPRVGTIAFLARRRDARVARVLVGIVRLHRWCIAGALLGFEGRAEGQEKQRRETDRGGDSHAQRGI